MEGNAEQLKDSVNLDELKEQVTQDLAEQQVNMDSQQGQGVFSKAENKLKMEEKIEQTTQALSQIEKTSASHEAKPQALAATSDINFGAHHSGPPPLKSGALIS